MGFGKTGTTALQSTLYANREALRECGLIYPDIGLHTKSGAHHVLSHEWGGWLKPEKTKFSDYGDFWRRLVELAEDDEANVLVSSEAFSGHVLRGADNFPSDLKDYLGDTPVRLLFYIRKQSEYLESQYRQLVKAGLYGKNIDCFIDEFGIIGDFTRTLDVLADTFGDDSLMVRIYDRQRMIGGSIFHDVLSLFDISIEQADWREGNRFNPSLSNNALQQALNVKEIRDPIRRKQALSQIARHDFESGRWRWDSNPLLTKAKQRQIMQRYDSINRKIGERYLELGKISPFSKQATLGA